jgi:hypothetical protein
MLAVPQCRLHERCRGHHYRRGHPRQLAPPILSDLVSEGTGRAFATAEHYVPTDSHDFAAIAAPEQFAMAGSLRGDSESAGIGSFGLSDRPMVRLLRAAIKNLLARGRASFYPDKSDW